MKKRVIICLLAVLLVFSLFSVRAEDYSFLIEGPATISAGDTLTIKLKVSGQEIYGLQATLYFNPNQLEFMGKVDHPLEGDWKSGISLEEDNILILNNVDSDDGNDTPINGQKDIMSLTFKVKDLSPDTDIVLSLEEQVITYGEGMSSVDGTDIFYTTKVVERQLSNNNYLKKLSISNASLSPAFNRETLNYTVTVPYGVSKLNLSAEVDAYTSNVNITNPDLKVGNNEVIIVVTAETNEKRTYKIVVTRQEETKETKSSNNRIRSMSADYPLTPLFNPDITDYLMRVPYDVTILDFIIEMEDDKASYELEGAIGLLEGDNMVRVLARAEDLSVQYYYISVFRESPLETEDPSPSPDFSPSPFPLESHKDDRPIVKESKGVPYWLVIILLIIFAIIGFVFGVSVNLKTNSDDRDDFDRFDEADYSIDDDSLFVIDDSVK